MRSSLLQFVLNHVIKLSCSSDSVRAVMIASSSSLQEAALTPALDSEAADRALASTMRRQRFQDFLFHKVTLGFALLVLLMLAGIIASLVIGATPAFREFGAIFLTTVEWDPVNDRYGALIAIAGTLITSFIALLVAFPVSFGIALFL